MKYFCSYVDKGQPILLLFKNKKQMQEFIDNFYGDPFKSWIEIYGKLKNININESCFTKKVFDND